jgi:hypothetical protein
VDILPQLFPMNECGISNLALLKWLLTAELVHVGKRAAWGWIVSDRVRALVRQSLRFESSSGDRHPVGTGLRLVNSYRKAADYVGMPSMIDCGDAVG